MSAYATITSDDVPELTAITVQIYQIFKARKTPSKIAFASLAHTLAHVLVDKVGTPELIEQNITFFNDLLRQIIDQLMEAEARGARKPPKPLKGLQ